MKSQNLRGVIREQNGGKAWVELGLQRAKGLQGLQSLKALRQSAAAAILVEAGVVCRRVLAKSVARRHGLQWAVARAVNQACTRQAWPRPYFCAAVQMASVVAPTGFLLITGSLLPVISVATVRS